MTYLQLVNDVLVRMRESTVASVDTTSYSKLIGKFINDTKRQVEDAWNWNALSTTITVTTVSGTSNYTLTGSGYRFKTVDVNNTTQKNALRNVPISYIRSMQQLATVSNSNPAFYAYNGETSGDSKVEFYPTPNSADTIKFNLYVPQADLASDSTVLSIPSEAIIMGAYARAIIERGEDGGQNSSEAYGMFKNILSDQIAIESTRFVENSEWVVC